MAVEHGTAVEIRLSDVDEMRREAGKLFEEHYEEIASNKHVMKLSPNWNAYYELEERGTLTALAAWTADELVGYSVSHSFQHLHYSELTVVQNDVLFVAKEHRKGGLGLRLIRRTEEIFEEIHAGEDRMVTFHAKPGSALDGLLPKLGFQVQDIIYSKAV